MKFLSTAILHFRDNDVAQYIIIMLNLVIDIICLVLYIYLCVLHPWWLLLLPLIGLILYSWTVVLDEGFQTSHPVSIRHINVRDDLDSLRTDNIKLRNIIDKQKKLQNVKVL